MELGRQPWPEVDQRLVLLIPLGSTEQHGPHLPLDTDAQIARAVAHEAAAATGSIVAPTLAYGASGEHAGFPGTLSIGTEALQVVLVELIRSASLTFSRTVLVNGHGGNQQGTATAVAQLRSEGHDVSVWAPSIPHGDAHAGRTETSLMLAIASEVVNLDKAEPGNTRPLSEIIEVVRSGGVAAASANGVLGDPTGASAAEGRSIIATLAADLVAHIDNTSTSPTSPASP